MLKSIFGACMAASLYSPAHAASATEPPSAAMALNAAIDGCLSTAASGRLDTRFPVEMFMMIPRSAGPVKSINDAPGLVKSFIRTSSGGAQPQFVYRFQSATGGIWAIARTMVDRCDIAVTGMSEQLIGLEAVNFFSADKGWQSIMKRDLTPWAPIGHYVFVKPTPLPRLPNYGLVASIKNLRTTAETADGLQIEINIAAGNIINAAGSVKVQTVRPAPDLSKP